MGKQNEMIMGIWDNYKHYMNHWIWKEKSKALKQNIPYCETCGRKKLLEVHHVTYSHVGQEKPGQLKVLCNTCHSAEHFLNKKRWM